jgi:hypothetical protein
MLGELIIFGILLGLAYFVYEDAKKHGSNKAILWAVLTFCFPLMGLLLYLIFRRPIKDDKK